MKHPVLSRWPLQSLAGIALVLLVSTGFGSLQPSAQGQAPQPAAASSSSDTCPEGFYGSAAAGCSDVNECASANGGCHKLASCKNEPGSRSCGACPKDFAGDGYVGCFDVNECPNGDCSDRIPTAADVESTPAPTVTTSGDVTVAAVAETGAPATFTVTAKDAKDRLRPAYCLPRSGSTFPIGKTVVSCWASDTHGKIGRATLTVTVDRPAF
jgi:hypothetical protein